MEVINSKVYTLRVDGSIHGHDMGANQERNRLFGMYIIHRSVHTFTLSRKAKSTNHVQAVNITVILFIVACPSGSKRE
ncbi:uncharacterized protein MCYG_07450 [Microsporum canis CBS 113480]|uniref:Uncharacterized protein n=1 Tax=Arthroderma otae (strain ATCC MYA-4605 / CBS 113480) TaxID=554155 RepID=C5FYN3_ARTOC|nr:uncharacterized protein MCYG_07450 [Microsporum canis CBS 113480]EEQ34631.1 hypothetical protein MCYG_07450 [Microsporum canis CBS 113480]